MGIVEDLHGRVLDGSFIHSAWPLVHGLVGLGQPVLEAVLPATWVEDVTHRARGWAGAVLRQIGKGTPLSVSTV